LATEIEKAKQELAALQSLQKMKLSPEERQAIGSGTQTGVALLAKKAAQEAQQTPQNVVSALALKEDLKRKAANSQGKKKEWYLNLLGSVDKAAGTAGNAFDGLDRYATNVLKNFYAVHSTVQTEVAGATIGATNAITGITAGVQQFEQEALKNIGNWGAGFKKALEPVGLCSAVGDLTDIVKNPLGAPQFLANSITSLVGKISPKFVQQMDSCFKSIKLDGLAHLPSKMMGSIRSLATAADAILSVPFEIMSDIYNGLMDILDAIADLIDAVIATVMNLIMAVVKALIDAIIPVDELLEFFSAIGDLASFVGDIAGMVGGFSAVANIAGQVGSFASGASNLINNPLAAIPGVSQAVGQVTGAVDQVTSALRNPEQFLPPEIGQQIQKISQIPGLGFVGNLGYSVGDTLDSLSDGVFSQALKQFEDKAPMIKSFFNKPQDEPLAVDIQEAHSDGFAPAKSGEGSGDTQQGLPTKIRTKILANGNSEAPYGISEDGPGGKITVNGSSDIYGMSEQFLREQERAFNQGQQSSFNLTTPTGGVSNNFSRL
jgi:chemotaxis regulatin CheY-phosphate phosphatase CheZ